MARGTELPSSRPVIGIAGGIGAGKTAVAKILGGLGCVVTHSDETARAALADPEIRQTLVRWWGDAILGPSGAIDRSALGRLVFSSPDDRRRLETLTHPWIEARRQTQFAAAPPDTPALVIDAPLLFEVGLAEACDAVIFVDAPRSLRLDRVRETRGWSDEELHRREESQLPLDVKRSGADYVIRNDGDLSQLEARIRTTLRSIVDSIADPS